MTVNYVDLFPMARHAPRMEQTPWYETVVFPALLRHARYTYGKAMRAALDEAGFDDIPGNGLYIIGGLALREGDIRIGQLVKELGITKQAAGQLVDGLVTRGYLSRAVDEKDRRQLIVALTKRGRAAAKVQARAREEVDSKLVARVGEDEVRMARRALGALIEMGREAAEAEA